MAEIIVEKNIVNPVSVSDFTVHHHNCSSKITVQNELNYIGYNITWAPTHSSSLCFFCWSFLFRIGNISNRLNPNKYSWAYNPTDQLQQEDYADPRILISEHGLLTPGWELFGVDYFGSIFLACAQLDTTSHNWKSSPEEKEKKTEYFTAKKQNKKHNPICTHSPLNWKKKFKLKCHLRNNNWTKWGGFASGVIIKWKITFTLVYEQPKYIGTQIYLKHYWKHKQLMFDT